MSADSRVAIRQREQEWTWCLEALASLRAALAASASASASAAASALSASPARTLELMALALRLLETAQGRPLLAAEVLSQGFVARAAALLAVPLPRALITAHGEEKGGVAAPGSAGGGERAAEQEGRAARERLLREHLQRRVALAAGVAGMVGTDVQEQHAQETALDAFVKGLMDMANEIHRNVALLRAAGRHDTQTFRELQLAFKSALSVARSLCQSAALAVPRVWSAPALLEMLVTDTGASPEASHDGHVPRLLMPSPPSTGSSDDGESDASSEGPMMGPMPSTSVQILKFLQDIVALQQGESGEPPALPWESTVAFLYEIIYRLVQAMPDEHSAQPPPTEALLAPLGEGMKTIVALAQHDGRVAAEMKLTEGLPSALRALQLSEASATSRGTLPLSAGSHQRQELYAQLLAILGAPPTILPAAVRPKVARPRVPTIEERQRAAASRIQAGWRGTQDRRRLLRATLGVIAFQRIWRAKAVRRRLQREHERKETMHRAVAREVYRQAWRRSKQEELKAVEALSPREMRDYIRQREDKAAIVLQSAYRRKQATRRVGLMAKVARQQNAAKKLQSVWRGLVARRRVAERYRSQRDADAAAETSDPRVHRYGLRRPDTDEERELHQWQETHGLHNVTREDMASKYHLAQEALMQYQAEQSPAKERARLKRLRALTRTTDLIKRLQDAPGSLEELSQADAQHWTEQLEALEPSLQEEGRRQHVVHMRSIYTPLSQQLTELQKESTAIAEYYSQDLYMHESENVYLSSFGILPEAPDHSERRS